MTALSGNRGRVRPKFSFRLLTHRNNLFQPTAVTDGQKPYEDTTKDTTMHNKLVHGNLESTVAEQFGNLHEESNELLKKVVPHDQRGGVPSMAELLEDLQEKDGPTPGPPDLVCIPNFCFTKYPICIVPFTDIHVSFCMFNISHQ